MSKTIEYGVESFMILKENRFKKNGKNYLRYDIGCTNCKARYYGVLPKDLLQERFVCEYCNIDTSQNLVEYKQYPLNNHPHLNGYTLLLDSDNRVSGMLNQFEKMLVGEYRNGKLYGFKIKKIYYTNKELLEYIGVLH